MSESKNPSKDLFFFIPILSALQKVHKAASYAGNSIPAAIRGQNWALRRIHQKYNT